MKKQIILLVFLGALSFSISSCKKDKTTAQEQISGNVEDLVSLSIDAGDKVKSPIAISGVIQSGYFFEANILFFALDEGKNVIGKGYGTADGGWMTAGPVAFSGTLDLPYQGRGYIRIQEDDPSGGEGGQPIRFVDIPVVFQ